jgi:hypothetical protein
MADLDTAAAAASSVAVGRSTLAAATAPVQEATAGCRARRTAAAATCRAIAVAVAVPAFTARASRAEATARRRQALWAALELWAARGSSSSRSSHPTSTAVAWERHLRLGVVLPHCLRVGGTVESTSPLLMSGHMSVLQFLLRVHDCACTVTVSLAEDAASTTRTREGTRPRRRRDDASI